MLHLMNSMPEHVKSNVEKNAGEGKLTIFRNDKYLWFSNSFMIHEV